MPPRKQRSWPPKAVLTLTDQVTRTVTISTIGTVPGKTGQNKHTAADSQLASWTLFWGDQTQQGGTGQPPASLTHTYPSTIASAVIRLVVIDINTLTASATLTVNGLTAAPDAPADLTASPLSDTSIRLDWTDPSMTAQTFSLERRTGVAAFAVIASGLSSTTLTYTDTGLTASTAYDYRVQAISSGGPSDYSNIASATTFPASPPVTPPAAPSALAVAPIGSTQINLTWTDNASDESGFFIERQTSGGSFSVIATVAANTVAYSDLPLSPSTLYGYRVRAFNAAGNSAYSNTASTTTGAPPPPAPPAAPSNLTATALTPTSVALVWTDNATTETSFQLERRVSGGAFTLLTTLASNITSFTDTTVSPSTTYDYRIRAINSGGASAYSNTATVTTPAIPPVNPPIAKLTSTITSLTLGQTLTLSTVGTQAGSNPLSTWSLDWNDGVIQNGPISTLPVSPTHIYAATGIYTPVLRVVDTIGNFDTDSPLPITVNPVVPPPNPPAAPSNLTTSLTLPATVVLGWTDNASNEAGTKIERRISPAAFAQINQIGPNIASYTDPNLSPSTTYDYRVRAFNVDGNSAYSNTASVVIPPSTLTFFISPSGNDTTGTGSIGNPWRTFNRGLQAVGAGSILFARAGVYPESLINNVPSGTSWASPVRIANYNAETVTVRPNAGSNRLLHLDTIGTQYIEFDGINMDGSLQSGPVPVISFVGAAQRVRYKNAEVIAGAIGESGAILLGTTTIGGYEIQTVVVHGGGTGGTCGTACTSVGVYLAASNSLVENCDIYDTSGMGIQIFGTLGPTLNNVVRNNRIHDVIRTGTPGQYLGIHLGSGANNNQIYNNLIYRIGPSGQIGDGINGFSNPTGNKVWNNTIYNNTGAGIRIPSTMPSTEVRNNILYLNAGGNYVNAAGTTVQSNNLIGINPLFVNPAANDFRLQAGSPALDTGMTLALVTTDIVGVLRPQGSAYDIGAYERPFP